MLLACLYPCEDDNPGCSCRRYVIWDTESHEAGDEGSFLPVFEIFEEAGIFSHRAA